MLLYTSCKKCRTRFLQNFVTARQKLQIITFCTKLLTTATVLLTTDYFNYYHGTTATNY